MRVLLSIHVYALLLILPVVDARSDGQPRPSSEEAGKAAVVKEAAVKEAPDQAKTAGAERGIETEVRTFRLKYASAQTASYLGAKVFKKVAASEKRLAPEWFSDSRTNTLIVTASKDQLAAIEAMVAKLDVPKRPSFADNQPYTTHLQLVVFETLVRRDRIVDLEAGKLAAKAGSCRSLREALGEFGSTKIRYRADQTVELKSKASLTIGGNNPFVRGTKTSKSGIVSKSVEYERVGCTVQLSGYWDEQEPTRGHATIAVELSSLSNSAIDLGNEILAPIFHRVKQRFDGPVTAGEPVVLLTIDASGSGETAVAHIVWVLFQRTP